MVFRMPLILGRGSSQAQSYRILNHPLLRGLTQLDIPPSWILLSLICLIHLQRNYWEGKTKNKKTNFSPAPSFPTLTPSSLGRPGWFPWARG